MKLPDIPQFAPSTLTADAWPAPTCAHCERTASRHVEGPGLALFCDVATGDQMQHMFHAITREGCARFGTHFYTANDAVVRLAHLYGLDPSEPALRAVLVTLAYDVCEKEQDAHAPAWIETP